MKRVLIALGLSLFLCTPSPAVVFLSEVSLNPAGSFDSSYEFIELQGTPGKKLDGYAVALVNGGQVKYHKPTPIPPDCTDTAFYDAAYPDIDLQVCVPEIDEFFSLDGLAIGPNGTLVLGVASVGNYPTVLYASAFRRWQNPNGVWNGGLDTPGKLQNDGCNTILLIRNRPGQTQADPTNPAGLRWGKDIDPDFESLAPDPPQPGFIQFGDGNLDKGQPNGNGGDTLDLKGASTPETTDDLEIVDEVSYEHDRGWEYDLDGRHVDLGSTSAGLPARHVHALDDPQGFNPDALTRVDYRTKGSGWTPVAGAVGEMPNGNNWPDTATEQWIRGETTTPDFVNFFYSNAANANPDAIQPYDTNVPRWLDDGSGADYDFGPAYSYPLEPGRINALAVPFIPGDADRDGDCDADDIAKVAAVFGDDDWVFSNSFAEAEQGDGGDPAAQTRPWDVDATGDNGVEASDLQWTLNFQGDATGRIVGVQYDGATPTPIGAGIVLNSNAGVACTVTTAANVTNGHALSGLRIGDTVELTVRAEVTGGANATAGEQNGVMQFVHDVAISTGGVVRVTDVQALAPFATTRAPLQMLQGAAGDLGITLVNGYTTSFTQGAGTPAALYRVTLEAIERGSTNVAITPAAMPKFAASTPHGLKVGHTDSFGNPASATYPAALALSVLYVAADFDVDGDVDVADFLHFQACFNGPDNPYAGPGCADADFDGDGDVDVTDFLLFQACFNGPDNPPGC